MGAICRRSRGDFEIRLVWRFRPEGQLYVTDNGYDERGSRPVWAQRIFFGGLMQEGGTAGLIIPRENH